MKTALNILMICKSMPWRFKGGIQTHTWQLAQALIAEGHQVMVLTAGGYKRPEKAVVKNGVNIVEIPYLPGRYVKPIAALAEEFAFNWAAKRWVQNHHEVYDIIHAQGRSGYLLYTDKNLRIKLINTIHGLISRETEGLPTWKLASRLHIAAATFFESRMMKHARQCLSVSKDLQHDMLKINKQFASEVIPNGVGCEPDEPMMLGLKPSRFLFIGRLHRVKGILPLVKSMVHAPKDISLDIVGNGPQKKALEKAIAKHGLGERVRLLGEKSNDEIQKLIPLYLAVVLPSFYETQGIVLLEANAHAVPVIASDLESIKESVTHQHNGLLCEAGNPEEFLKAMTQMARNPIDAQLMGIRGRKRVMEHYNWQHIARQTADTYLKIAC